MRTVILSGIFILTFFVSCGWLNYNAFVVKEKRVYSFNDKYTGKITGDSALLTVFAFDKSGNLVSEIYVQDELKVEYIYDENNYIISIVRYENGRIVNIRDAVRRKNGKIIPYVIYNPPEMLCAGPLVECIYNVHGHVISKIGMDESTGVILFKYRFTYEYFGQ